MRQILARQGGGLTHVTAIGSPEQVADQIETWVQAGAADGFNIMSAQLPDVATAFVDHVVPLLQRKGIPCELDLWGHDVAHDWPWWRKQLAHHLPRFC